MDGWDILYGIGVGAAAPVWGLRAKTRRKVLRAFSERMGHVPRRSTPGPAVMLHAVSLGEINATRALVQALRDRRPGLQFIVSVTTDTGYARGIELYSKAADVTLIRYPLDFSSAIERALEALRPSVVVLLELEVWPNFIRRCIRRGIPVLLINGRITPASFNKYRWAKPVLGPTFGSLQQVCVQDAAIADRFAALGVPRDRLRVTGTMKFDTAAVADRIEGQDELAQAVGLARTGPTWVCGSTGPGEEAHVLRAYAALLARFPTLRLAIIPRKPERFDEVAELISSAGFGLLRRSVPQAARPVDGRPTVVLGDTMGELRKFYALADVVLVGRTLLDLGARQHGSDMIEPAALARPVIVGPFTGNFADVMNRFTEADAMAVIQSPQQLEAAVAGLLADPPAARAMGQRAREVVVRGQGATARHAEIVLQALDSTVPQMAGPD